MPQKKIIDQAFVPSVEGNAIGIVCEDSTVRYMATSDSEIFYSLIGCVEDDAQNWRDLELLWLRNTASLDAPESINDLHWEQLNLPKLAETLKQKESSANGGNWLILSLPNSTIYAGSQAPALYLAGQNPDNRGGRHDDSAVELELAPWWKIELKATPSCFHEPSAETTIRVRPNRNVLWGREWIEFLAGELANLAKIGVSFSPGNSDPVIVKIHKAWLLTPRASLNNKTPRDHLHIAKDWIWNLHRSQITRMEEGLEPIPLPMEFSGYESAPFGKHEVIVYFDATRELLEYGYNWVVKNISSRKSKQFGQDLADALNKRFKRWMEELDSENLTPGLVVQFERQRIPLTGVEVEHAEVCTCPICQVIANGNLGPGFIYYDGHQLELDEEFAFSLFSTLEEWKDENFHLFDDDEESEDEDDSDDWEHDGEEGARDEVRDGDRDEEDDDSSESYLNDHSVDEDDPSLADQDSELYEKRIWTTKTPEEAKLPGPLGEKLGLAFLFAELSSEVDSLARSRANFTGDSNRLIELHGLFCMALETRSMTKAKTYVAEMKRIMARFEESFPQLVPRVADLTSRLDEELRKQNV